MPIVNGKYVNPGWVNGGPPAIDADELNAMSAELQKLSQDGSGAVDDALSSTSENPVQNKVIKAALDDISVAGELVCTLMEDGTLYVDNMAAVEDFEKEAF